MAQSSAPTILDAFREHHILQGSSKRDMTIPQGGSIPSPRPPVSVIYETICNNGSRRIPAYYVGGQRVTALGFPLMDRDRKAISKKACCCGPRQWK